MGQDGDSWEVYLDKRKEFRWRRRAADGKIVGSACEGYVQKAHCLANAQRHGMDGNPDNLGASDRWEVYRDRRDHYRWRRIARNGEVTGASTQGFPCKQSCRDNAARNGMQTSGMPV